MDRVTSLQDPGFMPPLSPLPQPIQQLDQPYHDVTAPKARNHARTNLWRLVAFLPAITATLGLIWIFVVWFAMDGFVPFEAVVIALVAVTFFWIALSFSTAFLGAATLCLSSPKHMNLTSFGSCL
jgi:membrane glycosyltransferase